MSELDGKIIMPNGHTIENVETTGFSPFMGRFYHNDKAKQPLDYFQEVYEGIGLGKQNLTIGDTIVTKVCKSGLLRHRPNLIEVHFFLGPSFKSIHVF